MSEENKITLKDITVNEIEDEVRWNFDDTRWAEADTPWQRIEETDRNALRQEMQDIIANELENFTQCRQEIFCGDRHIGLVTLYPLEAGLFVNTCPEGGSPAIGIEICEPDYWCHGYGTEALKAWVETIFTNYQNMESIYLETWSGNLRMITCAKKCGFSECERKKGAHIVDGKLVDQVLFRVRRSEIGQFLE